MRELLRETLNTNPFMPHGHCYLWTPALVWLHVLSDSAIGLAYAAISAMLVILVRRTRNLPFQWIYLCFGAFIISCGFTHFMEVWTVWYPSYWAAGGLKAVTAVASVLTAVLLPPVIPRTMALVRAAALAHERGVKLEAQNAELNALYERTRRLEQLKTEFFENISHDLRTPLTLIVEPVAQLLRADNLRGEQRRSLQIIRHNADELLRNVNELLSLSKLEGGRVALQYAEVDLSWLVRVTLAHFETLAEQRRIQVRTELPPVLVAQVDPARLQRLLLNLLANAFRYTPDGGALRCTLREGDAALPGVAAERGQVCLSVADSGPGVPEALREVIFDRFRQAEPARGNGGTGLGLAIAREIARLHQGTITVSDAPEGGALFTVALPRLAPPDQAVAPAPAGRERLADDEADVEAARLRLRPESEPSPGPDDDGPPAAAGAAPAAADLGTSGEWDSAGEPPLILVVDDNRDMRRFICDTLAPGYRTATAADGVIALAQAQRLQPDLIITDVMMPHLSGEGLLQALRQRGALAAVPVLVLTAKADDRQKIALLRHGAQDYLTKPFASEELRARVDNLVRMKRAQDVLRRALRVKTGSVEALAHELAQRQRQLTTALASTQVARDQAERASQVKTQFLSLVSHELRTPLTTLGLSLDRLIRDRESPLTERQQGIIARMTAASRRLLELIEGLLEYVRIESGRLVVEPTALDLPALAADVLEELRPQAEAKGLRLQLSAAAAIPPLRSDERLLRLVLVNLVGNALKFTERGEVTLTLSFDDRDAAPAAGDQRHCVTVRDTGPGIPRDHLARIFDPFHQVEPIERKHTPGVGLGLSLVRQLVEALGGQVQVDSQVGVGSVFQVRLPSLHARA